MKSVMKQYWFRIRKRRQIQKAKAMKERGYTTIQIANNLEISESSVRMLLK